MLLPPTQQDDNSRATEQDVADTLCLILDAVLSNLFDPTSMTFLYGAVEMIRLFLASKGNKAEQINPLVM